jgi:hypothetical protein
LRRNVKVAWATVNRLGVVRERSSATGPPQAEPAGPSAKRASQSTGRSQFHFRVLRSGAREQWPKLHGARPEDRKDNAMNAFHLVIAWLAVAALVLIARTDYRARRSIR